MDSAHEEAPSVEAVSQVVEVPQVEEQAVLAVEEPVASTIAKEEAPVADVPKETAPKVVVAAKAEAPRVIKVAAKPKIVEPVVVYDPLYKVDPPRDNEAPTPAAPKLPPGPFAYRHYQPFHPCCNKILAMKWDRTLQKQHRKKVYAAKATVNNSSPKPYVHLQVKLKKVQMEQGI
jgi:hypothetical protein